MRYVVLLLFMLVLAAPALAQTETPTSTPTYTPTPTPTGTPIFLPEEDIADAIRDSNEMTGQLPAADDSFIPRPNLRIVFGYAKWLIAPETAEALAGPFRGVIQHLGLYFLARFVLFGVYALVFLLVYIFRWTIWFLRLAIQVAQVLVALVGSLSPIRLITRLFGG